MSELDESKGMIALKDLQEDLIEYPIVADICKGDVNRIILGMRFQVTYIDEKKHAVVLELVREQGD